MYTKETIGGWLTKADKLIRSLAPKQLISVRQLALSLSRDIGTIGHNTARIHPDLWAAIGRVKIYGNPETIKAFKADPNGGFFLDGQPYQRAAKAGKSGGPASDVLKDEIDASFGEKTGIVTTKSLNIQTLADALRVSQVDLKVWEVERHVINSWEVTIGSKNNDGKQPGTYTNYQVKVWLKRITPTIMEVSIENLLKRIEDKAKPRTSNIEHRTLNNGNRRFLLEVSLFDAHFGLLAWSRETGDDYDLKIAEEAYELTMCDLLDKTAGCQPERILLPFGNDFFHVNNPEGTTPMAHNVLDVDGRLCKVVETGERALFRAVERCLKIAPVEVIWIPGNHDPETSYFICRILKAQFHGNPNVTVNVEPSPRKYIHYGVNLLGFTHGNEEKHADLPTIMAAEKREVWGEVSHCEWHIGHYHKPKETRYSAADTYGGVRVRVIPSISGTDAWHFKKGYVQGNRMAESFLYDHDDGLVATYVSKNLRQRKRAGGEKLDMNR